MKILVLGGTSFLGRTYVEQALALGHDVTTFNRGVTGPDVAGVEAVRGDRTVEDDLAKLSGRTWDAVIDTSGFVPKVVGASVRALADSGTYVFVSTIAVYRDWPAATVDEPAPLHACPPTAGPDDGDDGELKAGCERAVVRECGGGGALLLRPGVILGPYENIGRLPWWLRRVARGGEVLALGPDPQRSFQQIDARDCVTFTFNALESERTGAYNLVSRPGATTYGSFLQAFAAATGSDAELVWPPDDVLVEAGIVRWDDELPLWSPLGEEPAAWEVDVEHAYDAGLRCRPFEQTAKDTWAWLQDGGTPTGRHADALGIDPGKEQRILAAVRGRA